MAPPPAKRPRKVLTLETKREILRRCDEGWSTARIRENFGIPKSSLCELKKARDKITAYTDDFSVASKTGKKKDRKTMAKPMHVDLDQCVIKWYQQQRGSGVMVRGTELKMAAERFGNNIGLHGFKASEGWLYRFKLRHGLSNKKMYGETLDANEDIIDGYCKEVKELIQREGLLLEQLYNFDETGLYYRSIPENTLASEKEKSVPGRKLCKARVSLMCGANALGSHRLKPIIVGKAKQPRCLRGMMDSLPLHYDNSLKAWFNVKVFKNWFFKQAVPEIVRFQMEVMKVSRDRVRALIFLDNAPAHPAASELVAEHGRIRVKFLPPNTTSLIQPMDQGIIVAFKRLYRRRFLEEVMVVVDEEDRNVGQLTLQNLKSYNLRSVIYNISRAWNDVSSSTLANGWNRLLHRTEPVVDFEGFAADDFHRQFVEAGENTTVDDINDWLECDEGDPGQQVLTEEQIAAEVLNPDEGNDSEDDDDDSLPSRPTTSEARKAADVLLDYFEHPISSTHMQSYGPMLREVRDALIKAQSQWSKKQTKIETFFKPTTPSPHPTPSPNLEMEPSQSTRPDSLSPDDVPLPSLPSSPRSSETPQPIQDIDTELKSASEDSDE
ncbi:hypothetical protein Pcinc_004667 [Petrolisthes cinctipes]|uniref:HTH CENPB-type domain-containing protein n=1 Tax=Petrolisthes cinctipes TaxID=88211 RepID=A0AAE1GGF5_PETCI|nr:hypothetical protein Pcinc_004667 [Petrolisthes cinctipes]